MKEAEVGEMCSEEIRRGHKPRLTGSFQKVEDTRERIFPGAS